MPVAFGVLGPVAAWDGGGAPVALRGPRHRAVLARLLVARGRVVPVDRLVEDLWPDPPPGGVAAVRTFVAALRRALEPARPPRTPARLLVTSGPGYALHADDVDAERFARAVTTDAGAAPAEVAARLGEALGWWRGPAYADVAGEPWARAERARLGELRLLAVERRAEARLALGLAAEVAADLDAHVAEHPWREEAWALLARALSRAERQGDALAVLRRARALLVGQLGVDPGPALRRAEADVLRPADDPAGGAIGRVWAETAAAYDRAVAPGARVRLEATVGLLRPLAVTGGRGLLTARAQRAAAIAAAAEHGDPELSARVVGAYDVPALWTRSDDPAQAAAIVAAAERALRGRPAAGSDRTRARLLATVAVESRGTGSARARAAAEQAERLARDVGDPALLAFALNGVFLQSFHRTGLARRRDAVGAELVELGARHGLATSEVLGHLVRVQARAALADLPGADRHAEAADRLGDRHGLPLVAVFTRWYGALRRDAAGDGAEEVEAAYRRAAAGLAGAGMPGLERGLLPLALLGLRVRRGLPLPAGPADPGPYEPWARPLVLLAQGRRGEAAAALAAVPDPPADLLSEALWCLVARAASELGDRVAMERARVALTPAAGEHAAGSGLLTLGPVSSHLDDLAGGLRSADPP